MLVFSVDNVNISFARCNSCFQINGKMGIIFSSSFSSFSPAAKHAIDNGGLNVRNQKISFSSISSSLPKVSKLLEILEDIFLATGRYFSV